MKKFISGILVGVILSVGVVFAIEYNIYPNPYRIMVDNKDVEVEAYNINDKTYLQLRDIAKALGNVNVDFKEDTILINKKTETPTPTPAPTATSDLPEDARTKDDLPMRHFGDGVYYVPFGVIQEKIKSVAGIGVAILGNKFYSNGQVIKEFDDIPYHHEHTGDILVDYYYSEILPWIEGLEE